MPAEAIKANHVLSDGTIRGKERYLVHVEDLYVIWRAFPLQIVRGRTCRRPTCCRNQNGFFFNSFQLITRCSSTHKICFTSHNTECADQRLEKVPVVTLNPASIVSPVVISDDGCSGQKVNERTDSFHPTQIPVPELCIESRIIHVGFCGRAKTLTYWFYQGRGRVW